MTQKHLAVRCARRILGHLVRRRKNAVERRSETAGAARGDRKDRREILRVALYDLRRLVGRTGLHPLLEQELAECALDRGYVGSRPRTAGGPRQFGLIDRLHIVTGRVDIGWCCWRRSVTLRLLPKDRSTRFAEAATDRSSQLVPKVCPAVLARMPEAKPSPRLSRKSLTICSNRFAARSRAWSTSCNKPANAQSSSAEERVALVRRCESSVSNASTSAPRRVDQPPGDRDRPAIEAAAALDPEQTRQPPGSTALVAHHVGLSFAHCPDPGVANSPKCPSSRDVANSPSGPGSRAAANGPSCPGSLGVANAAAALAATASSLLP